MKKKSADNKKYLDKPWKIFLWIIVAGRVLKIPLRLFNIESFEVLAGIGILIFIAAVLITGFYYGKYLNKQVPKKDKLRVTLYIGILTLIVNALVVVMLAGALVSWTEAALSVVINSAITYFLLNIGAKWGIQSAPAKVSKKK